MFNTQNIITSILNNQNEKYNKSILYYNINIFYFDLFNIIRNKIEKIKVLKYKNLIEYKELILYYNNFIKKYNIYIYGIKYEIFTIDLFKKKNINNICLIPEISPFKISHHIYNNIIKIKKKSYIIKGFICFIVVRRTKRQETIKIYIFSNIKHKENNYFVYDIRELLNFVSPQLLREIDILVKNDLVDMPNEDIYVGYLVTISCDKTDYNKNNFLDIINFYNDYVNTNLYMNIYFKIYQYKKNTNNYKFMPINQDICKNFNNIYYNLEYNDNYKDPGIVLENNNIYIVSSNFIKTNFSNNFIINDNLEIETLLTYKDIMFKYITNFKSLLYSTELLYILKHTEKLYIADIYITNKCYENTTLYQQINKDYILKKNNIVFKKNISKSLEMLLKIDTNVINWYDFINNSDNLYENVNLYDWFIENYNKYLLKNPSEGKQISLSFKCLSLFDIFTLVFDDENFKNFIIYYNKVYKLENKTIVKKNGLIDNNHNYDHFIDIIRIFLYLYNIN